MESTGRDFSVLLVVPQNLSLEASYVAVTREEPTKWGQYWRNRIEKHDEADSTHPGLGSSTGQWIAYAVSYPQVLPKRKMPVDLNRGRLWAEERRKDSFPCATPCHCVLWSSCAWAQSFTQSLKISRVEKVRILASFFISAFSSLSHDKVYH